MDANDIWKSAGDEPTRDTFRPKQRTARQPKEYRSAKDVSPKPRPSKEKPAEVSTRVWLIAEHFLESGRAAFSRQLPVNQAEFSKRLAEKINSDRDVQQIIAPRDWDADHKFIVPVALSEEEFTARAERVNDIIGEMIVLFWKSLEAGDSWDSWMDRKFLDEWDTLWYRSVQNLEVRSLMKGIRDGSASKRPMKFKMVPEEKRAAHRLRRLQIRLRNQKPGEEREPLTAEERAGFDSWVASRKRTRDSVAN